MVKDITFNVLYWSECNEIENAENNDNSDNIDEYDIEPDEEDTEQNEDKYTIRLFGRTSDDKTVFVKVTDFPPHFYVEIPDRWKTSDVNMFVEYLKSRVTEKNKIDYSKNLCSYDIVERHKFYGFTAGKLYKFLRLLFNNSNAMKKFTYVLNEKIRLPRLGLNSRRLKIYESNIDPMLRCMHIRNLLSCGWIKISKYTKLSHVSNTDISITTHFKYLHPIDTNDVSNIKIMSFDIECTSEDGTFPQAKRKNDKIISIGSTFSRYGNPDCYLKTVIQLDTCDPIPGVEVIQCKTEVDVLIEWNKLLHRENPDIITGYNIVGFDEKYIYDRAVKLGCNTRFCSLSRLIGEQCKFNESSSTTKAFGQNEVKQYDITGVVTLDLLKHMFKGYNLPSYKLDYVAEHFIRGNILDYDIVGNTTIFKITGIKDLNIENYIAIEDDHGDKYLDGKKYQIIDISETTITVNDKIELRTSDVITTLKFKWCLAKDDVTPDEIFSLQKGSSADRARLAKYCVQDCAICNKLLAKLDILTNQIAMANVCHVPLSYIISRGQGIKIFSLVAKTCRLLNYLIPVIKKGKENNTEDEQKYEGATVLTPEPGFYEDPIPVLDYASLYPSSMIHKNISHESLLLFFEYDNLPDYIYYDVEYINEDGSKTKCRYAKHKNGTKGILPQILSTLLSERRATKKIMEKEIDPLKKSILDGKQLALKITANSLYGQTGAPTSQIYLKTIAASTTATGREMLMTAQTFTEGQFNDIMHSVIDYSGIEMFIECMKNIIEQIRNEDDQEIVKINVGEKITENNLTDIKKIFNKILREFCKNRKGNCVYNLDSKTIDLKKDLIVKKEDNPIDNKTGFLIATKFRIERIMESKYTMKAKTIYGDSVIGNTPLLVKKEGKITSLLIKNITNVYDKNYHGDKEFKELNGYQVWTDSGWTNIESVIRHKLPKTKKLYKISTKLGSVVVTDDHSLLDKNGNIVKPTELEVGYELLHSFTTEQSDNKYVIGMFVSCLAYDTYDKNTKSFMISKEQYSNDDILYQYYMIKQSGMKILYNDEDENIIFEIVKEYPEDIYSVTKIEEWIPQEEYVYDLTTENHHFQAGLGEIIVHNTDSIFVNMNVSDKESGKHLTDHLGLVKSMNLGILCGDLINQILPPPHNLEYEKTLWPFLITSKKRYVGNLYEFDPNKYYQKSMGIELKRRDNAKIVKKIVGNIIHILLNDRDAIKAVSETKKNINNLMCGKYPMSDFIITKTLKANYADRTRIAHVALADRMGVRDPGSKPQVNERIPFVYIEVNEKKGKKILQGERIEHPDFIKKHNLRIDYLFYLTNQVMKPALRMLTHVTKNPSSMFTECINKETNRRNKIIPLTNWITTKKVTTNVINLDKSHIVDSESDDE